MPNLEQPKRPVGITIFSILHTLGGIGFFAILFYPFPANENLAFDSKIYLSFVSGFLGLVLFSSGIGMWLGRQWGWRLSIFYYVFGIVRYLTALLISFNSTFLLQASLESYLRVGFRIIFSIPFIYYFFRANVLDFFLLKSSSKLVNILSTIGVAIIVWGGWTIFVNSHS